MAKRDNPELYEQFDWTPINTTHLGPKIEKVIEWIPEDVHDIVDIGCGNGVITNELSKQFNVTGVDRSENALKYVKTKKLTASADQIPLPDESFDMVFSSELLEHLDDTLLAGTIAELKRLTKKYIFITVPNDENPDKLSIKCPQCNNVYNSPNHLRRFNKKDFSKLFPEFTVVKTLAFGRKVRYYNPIVLNLKMKFTPANSWIPTYWMKAEDRNTFCPNCEHPFRYPYQFNLLATGLDLINVIISPKKPSWLFVLMEKK